MEEHVDAWRCLLQDVRRTVGHARNLGKVAERLALDEGYDVLRSVECDLSKLEQVELGADVVERARLAALPVRAWLAAEWQRRAGEASEAIAAHFSASGIRLIPESDGSKSTATFK